MHAARGPRKNTVLLRRNMVSSLHSFPALDDTPPDRKSLRPIVAAARG